MNVEQTARAFGLHLESDGRTSLFTRAGRSARLATTLSVSTPAQRSELLAACLGARLGLDRLQFHSSEAALPPTGHEQRLMPRSALALAAAISRVPPASATWLHNTPFATLNVHEIGKDLVFIADTETRSDTSDEGRRATFYRAYQLRPAHSEALGAGRLLTYRTTGGLACSVAALFPDYDLDAARDRGVLAVPDYDSIIVWRPGEGERAGSALRRAVLAACEGAPLPFSQRLYSLRLSGVVPGEVSGAAADFDPAELAAKLIQVTS